MKNIRDPTAFFIKQSQNENTEWKSAIDEFRKGLIDLEKCVVCRNPYDLDAHTPRILVHCGHTVCEACILHNYKNMIVRCPICHKAIK